MTEVNIPGSKYIANRALIIAALTNGKSTIRNVPVNEDIQVVLKALRGMGMSILSDDKTCSRREIVEVWGVYSEHSALKFSRRIDVGESGTLMRFAVGLACLLKGETTITAGKRNSERPIRPLLQALKDLGASISETPGENPYPLLIKKGLSGGKTAISGEMSSQFISSLLIVSPYASNDVEIKVLKPIVSSGYIDMTISTMESSGVRAERIRGKEFDLFKVKAGQKYMPCDLTIPRDWSSANCLIAASVLLNRKLTIHRIDVGSNPGESEFISILQRMGCSIRIKADSIEIHKSGVLMGIEVDMKDSPDSVLTLIAIALYASGTTAITNISHLIHKESDRIKQVVRELRKIGADIVSTSDSITITGMKPLHEAVTESHNDHRLAMCLGLIKLKNQYMSVMDTDCVQKSFPEFWKNLQMIKSEGEKCLEIQ